VLRASTALAPHPFLEGDVTQPSSQTKEHSEGRTCHLHTHLTRAAENHGERHTGSTRPMMSGTPVSLRRHDLG
jgi:hypothetical protein